MILTDVKYWLFPYEVEATASKSAWHQLDGEIELSFKDQHSIHISWAKVPVQYCIGVSDRPYNRSGTLQVRSLATHQWWSGLIGCKISLDYLDDDHQVMRIIGTENSIYLSSQDEHADFNSDCMRVSSIAPFNG